MEIGPPNILRPDTRPRQTATKQSSGELPSGQAQSQGSAISFTSFMQGSCTRRLMKGGSCAPRARHSCATSRDLTRHERLQQHRRAGSPACTGHRLSPWHSATVNPGTLKGLHTIRFLTSTSKRRTRPPVPTPRCFHVSGMKPGQSGIRPPVSMEGHHRMAD